MEGSNWARLRSGLGKRLGSKFCSKISKSKAQSGSKYNRKAAHADGQETCSTPNLGIGRKMNSDVDVKPATIFMLACRVGRVCNKHSPSCQAASHNIQALKTNRACAASSGGKTPSRPTDVCLEPQALSMHPQINISKQSSEKYYNLDADVRVQGFNGIFNSAMPFCLCCTLSRCELAAAPALQCAARCGLRQPIQIQSQQRK